MYDAILTAWSSTTVSNRNKHNAEGLPGIFLAWVASVITVRQQRPWAVWYDTWLLISAKGVVFSETAKSQKPLNATYQTNVECSCYPT